MVPPQMKRLSNSGSSHVLIISGPSPISKLMGSMMMAEIKLEYQAKLIVDPSTTLRDDLMVMAWQAVVMEDRNPKRMPRLDRVYFVSA